MQLLSETILWTLIIYIAVTIHFLIIEYHHKTPIHWVSFLIVLAIAIWISASLYEGWYLVTVNTIYLGLEYWILFNSLLNFYRYKDFLYLGDKSFLDRLEKRAKNPGATLGLKFVMMVACAFILLQL